METRHWNKGSLLQADCGARGTHTFDDQGFPYFVPLEFAVTIDGITCRTCAEGIDRCRYCRAEIYREGNRWRHSVRRTLQCEGQWIVPL